MEEGLDGVVLLLEVGFALCVQVILNRVITGEAKLLLLLLQNVNVKKFTGFKAERKDQKSSSFAARLKSKVLFELLFWKRKDTSFLQAARGGFPWVILGWGAICRDGGAGGANPQLALPSVFEPSWRTN